MTQLSLPVISPFADGYIERSARFAAGGRVELARRWTEKGPVAAVIGCNPSVADETKDDPTCRWWINWFRENGFAAFRALNLYPFVTSSPAECRQLANWHETNDWHARDQIDRNLSEIVKIAKEVDQVFVCWGAIAWDDGWVDHVVEEIQSGVAPYPPLWCWGFNLDGSPRHPASRGRHRLPANPPARIWRAA